MKLNLQKHYALRQTDIDAKKYHCFDCDKSFRDKYSLTKHLNGLKHHPERKVVHECKICNYVTKHKNCINQHNQSQKHKNATEALE
jgi:hypothetical protein